MLLMGIMLLLLLVNNVFL